MPHIHNAGTGIFYPHELIVCVFEGFLFQLLCIYNRGRGMETLDLHELIGRVSEGLLSVLIHSHIVYTGTSGSHGRISCDIESCNRESLHTRNVCRRTFYLHGLILVSV